jgi:hypothetical protein
MKRSCEILVSSLLFVVVAGALAGCNKNADLTPTGTVQKTSDPTAMAQQGQGGSKAREGGGMVPDLKPAAPGEKTGIPN